LIHFAQLSPWPPRFNCVQPGLLADPEINTPIEGSFRLIEPCLFSTEYKICVGFCPANPLLVMEPMLFKLSCGRNGFPMADEAISTRLPTTRKRMAFTLVEWLAVIASFAIDRQQLNP